MKLNDADEKKKIFKIKKFTQIPSKINWYL